MKKIILFTAALTLSVTSVHAQSAKAVGTAATAHSQKAQVPMTDGEVRKVNKAAQELTLKHGDLPSIGMGPMTMVFNVADSAMLNAVKTGDKVKFSADIIQGKPTVTRLEPVR